MKTGGKTCQQLKGNRSASVCPKPALCPGRFIAKHLALVKQSDECGRQPWKVEFEPESQPVLNLSMKRKYNNRTGHFWNRSDVFLIVGIIVAIIAAVVVALN